jgi:hypothetical protein
MEIESESLSILVEAPKPSDLSFYGQWFLAADHLETLWTRVYEDPDLKKRIDRLLDSYVPDFAMAASDFYMSIRHRCPGFILCLGDAVANEFVMMADLGFFSPHGDHYRLALPEHLSLDQVAVAALKYAATEDSEYMLHPENLVRGMPSGDARHTLERLRATARFAETDARGSLH